MSYAGQFNITVIADRDTYSDLDIFVAGVQDELQALATAMLAEPRMSPEGRRQVQFRAALWDLPPAS
jgi:hypothetical protein